MFLVRVFTILLIIFGGVLNAGSATPLKWGFVGNGFHVQFFIEHNSSLIEHTYTFELPNSFIIDTAEAENHYSIVSTNENLDVTSEYLPLSLKMALLCDIEAPVFTVSKNNTVTINLRQKDSGTGHNANEIRKLVFPIHIRYEALSQENPSSILSFLGEREAYVTRCISGADSASNLSALEDFQTNQEAHCRSIPVPYLSDLSLVYTTLVFSLVAGSVIAILSLFC